ncbi:MAG: A24 family peptidase C-terminal domain-containing protein, partial [Nanobdellota archaeon]
IAFSLLTPVTVYSAEFVRYFPGAILLINSIIIVLVFLLFQLIKNNYKELGRALVDLFKKPKEILYCVEQIFILDWLFRFIFSFLNIRQTTFFVILGLFLVTIYFGSSIRYYAEKHNFIILLLIGLRVIFDSNLYTLFFLKTFLLIVLIFVFLRLLLEKLSDRAFSKKTPISNLKEGMMTDQFLINTGEKIVLRSPDEKTVPGKNFIVPSAEGFTKEEIIKIKNEHKKGRLDFKYIYISSRTFFAPYLFVSCLVTILIGGSVLTFIPRIISLLIETL